MGSYIQSKYFIKYLRCKNGPVIIDMDYGGECPMSNDRSIMGLNDKNLQKILKFGREIFQLSLDLDINESSTSRKMLKVNLQTLKKR